MSTKAAMTSRRNSCVPVCQPSVTKLCKAIHSPTSPVVKGSEDSDIAPISVKSSVTGIFLAKAPMSSTFLLPTACMTAPALMNNNPFMMLWLRE